MVVASNVHRTLRGFYPPRNPGQRLAWEIVFLIPIIVAVALFGSFAAIDVLYTGILSIIFAVNIVLRFKFVNDRGDWIFFLIGIAGGGGNDLLSMIRGVYDYTSLTYLPFLNDLMPVWMICFWGQVFLLFRKIFNFPLFSGEEFKKNNRFLKGWVHPKLLVDIGLIVLLRTVIYTTYNWDAWIPALIYGVTVIARFVVFRPRKNEWCIIAILPYAFIFEGLMVSFGLYVYYNPAFMGLPLWLMIWWMFLVPIFIKEVFDMVEYVLKQKGAKSEGAP
nr:DUF2878 family protein [Candidatus Sigynarchaeota archaeon]